MYNPVAQNRVANAHLIAYIAHAADGATRADKVTPYITHPRRVVELIRQWWMHDTIQLQSLYDLDTCLAAGYMHDVLEDTEVRSIDLVELGVDPAVLDTVVRLTKKDPHKPATPEYYQDIASSDFALIVKCADRCSNLEGSIEEVRADRNVRRWAKYADKTEADIMPMYKTLPLLRNELQSRLSRLRNEVIAAECRKNLEGAQAA